MKMGCHIILVVLKFEGIDFGRLHLDARKFGLRMTY